MKMKMVTTAKRKKTTSLQLKFLFIFTAGFTDFVMVGLSTAWYSFKKRRHLNIYLTFNKKNRRRLK